MQNLEDSVSTLSNIIELTRGSGTNIYARDGDDPRKDFKDWLVSRSFFIRDAGRGAYTSGHILCLIQIEADVFKTISEFPALDNDRLEYLELANAAYAVVTEVNRAAT